MRSVALSVWLLLMHLNGAEGEEVFTRYCVTCHESTLSGADHSLKAPPMPMVVMRLKGSLQSKEAFVEFVNRYIQKPDRTKGLCMPMAYRRFGVMPPIGAALSDVERQTVAAWLYDSLGAGCNCVDERKMCQH